MVFSRDTAQRVLGRIGLRKILSRLLTVSLDFVLRSIIALS
jgi:hypothetical protein